MKLCKNCGTEKPITDFYRDPNGFQGYRHACKVCEKQIKQNNIRKKEESMSDLIDAVQVAEQFSITETFAKSYIEAAKVRAHKLTVGKVSMTLYDKAEALKAVELRIKEEKEIQAANLARLEAAKIPTIKDVMASIKSIAADLSDVAELAESVKKINEQNVIMFKVLTEFKTDSFSKMADLRSVLTSQNRSIDTPLSIGKDEKNPVLKVGIVGLHSGDHTAIKKEFGELFKLSILTPDESRKITCLKNMDQIYLMSKYVSHRHMDLVKAIGHDPIIVPGTCNELKEKLTVLYLSR